MNFKSAAFRMLGGVSTPLRLAGDIAPSWPSDDYGLYLHVPFCRTLCPFCPYNRVRYSTELYTQFETAVCRELDHYLPILKGRRITSFYIGGGTPTVDPEGLVRLIARTKSVFPGEYPIAVELSPAACDAHILSMLQNAGVSQVSVGVQSLSEIELRRIGRNHNAAAGLEALRECLKAGFTVNADLMFALPNQNNESWRCTLDAVLQTGVHEISTYPMFSFSYTKQLPASDSKSRRAPEKVLRRRLEIARQVAEREGFVRSTVWSWTKPRAAPFSSVTRHRYVGLGPGAASMTGSSFYINTFSVPDYARTVGSRLPIALTMHVPSRLSRIYWLYWSLYALAVSRGEFRERFGGMILDDEFGAPLAIMRRLGWLRENSEGFTVTNAGAYWIHRLQNVYSLRYLERLWGACLREPWPKTVCL